ncbi:alpha/beta hydrolase [Marinobacter nanhaiticus D15-8W]|uniref:Alpha/beta hydrolase n=2 Tax=Marinobacter TaxID=2742 RepID=N6WW32_9GAMM|nr:alpha/beta hydrolase [Marinobacter nanhaiticus D15-8W]
MLAHGFGCDQRMWRDITRGLSDRYTLVLFDYVGSGRSQLSAFKKSRYRTLEGYARDVNEICQVLELADVTFVGHSVSGTIGLLASLAEPEHFARQIMVCPSPCFLNDPPGYHGGFERSDLEELIDLMDKNYIGWASYLAPLVMGMDASDELIGELADSFCSTDPLVARTFAEATFFSDYRHRLAENQKPALILQSKDDALANESVGHYMHAQMPHSTLNVLDTQGHCIHMTHPSLVLDAIHAYLDGSSPIPKP